jgi:hypothetical protein
VFVLSIYLSFPEPFTGFEFGIRSPHKNKFIKCEFCLYQAVTIYASLKYLNELV